MSDKFKIPDQPGDCVDLLYQLRQQRYELQHQAKELEKQETALRDHLYETLPRAQLQGAMGKLARFEIGCKRKPVIENFPLFMKWVNRRRAYGLLQRRLNDKAIFEMVDDGKKIDGLGFIDVETYSLTKR